MGRGQNFCYFFGAVLIFCAVALAQEPTPTPAISPAPAPVEPAASPFMPKPSEIPPRLESRPPPSSLLYLSLPRSGADPMQVVMPMGPLTVAAQDMEEFRSESEKKGSKEKSPNCYSFTLAGMSATRDMNLSSAEEFMQRAVNSDCDDGMPAFYLGAIYEHTGRYQQAVKMLQIARAQLSIHHPEHRYVHFSDAILGRAYFRLGRFQEALYHLEQVLQVYPQDLPHSYFSGLCLIKMGFTERGLKHLERVVVLSRIVPNSKSVTVESCKVLGEIYLRVGQWVVARNYIQEGLKLDPKNKSLRDLLAKCEQARLQGERRQRGGNLFQGF